MHLSFLGTNLKNFVSVEIGFIKLQPIRNSHVHFLIFMESAKLRALLQWYEQMICRKICSFIYFWKKVLRRMFGGIKVNGNCWKRYNKEFMQLFGNLDILSFVRVRRLSWIGHVDRMDNRRKVSQVFKNNPQGSRLRGRPRHRWWNCVQTGINKCKITNWKKS
jgi:hypothetical protein